MHALLPALDLNGDADAAELLFSLLAANQDCVRVLSLDGRVRYVNPAGLRLIEVPDLADVQGALWSEKWPEESRHLVDAAIAAAREGRSQSFRAICYSRGGARMWWDTVVSPMRRGGEIAWLLAVSRDVTVSAEAQTFYDTLVHVLPHPLFVKSATDGRYVLVNRAAEEAFGVGAADVLGRTPTEVFGPEVGEAFALEDQQVIARRDVVVSVDERTETIAGVRYFTTKKLATFDDAGRPLHIVAMGEDVTERRATLDALRHALEAAEAANAAKSAFLANMSHEIRTPMNGVVAGADMLSRRDLDEASHELVEIIRSSSRTLEALLTDILDVARIEAGQLTLEAAPFHLGELVRSAAALARLRADERGVALEVEIAEAAERWVLGDAVRVRQVLMNLLSNAVKFTERGRVSVRVQMLAEGEFRIKVADTGIGFDPDFKARLFDRFQQADGSITRRFGGTGLGMAISRDLVALMGGRLDCESEAGVGATFWFDLPLAMTDAPASESGEGPSLQGGPRLQILLADDHPTNRKVVQLMLNDIADVVSVENGEQAVLAYGAGAFDLVLMDMQMPVMDGLQAVRRIRELECADGEVRTPIVMLTANALAEHVSASLAAGADRHVQKPVTFPSLIGAILDLTAAEPMSAPGSSAGHTA